MQVFVDADKLRIIGAAFRKYTIEPRTADLKDRDTDGVNLGHQEREIEGRFS